MDSTLPIALLIVGACSTLSALTSAYLTKSENGGRLIRTISAGALPTILIVAVLVIGHLIWLAQQPSGHQYSPLAFLIYGFWLVASNFAANLAAAFRFRQ